LTPALLSELYGADVDDLFDQTTRGATSPDRVLPLALPPTASALL
jgi:hypothetical protein